jgi:hypothetical protein
VGAGAATGSNVPPWLAARTPPAPVSAPPPPKQDAFYDRLRQAVGDEESDSTGDNAGAAAAAESAGAGQAAPEAAPANGESSDSSRSWFGRKR